jgi:hypothetical protein
MPKHVDNLTLAIAVERPNIFAVPVTAADDGVLAAESVDGGNVFSSATAARERDGRALRLRRAPLSARAVQLLAGGVSLRRCVTLAVVVAVAVALLVLHEVGGGDAERRSPATAGMRVGIGSAAVSQRQARRRSVRVRKPQVRARSERRRRDSSRAQQSPRHGRCCRRRSSRRGAARAASRSRAPKTSRPPAPPTSSPPRSVPPTSPDRGTPAPVPMGAPPEFM